MFISIQDLDKTYPLGGGTAYALRGVNLQLEVGQLVFAVGKSGSGKSTLLNLIAGLDRPTRGQVHVAGRQIHDLNEDSLSAFGGEHVGIVFLVLPAAAHPHRERERHARNGLRGAYPHG